MEANHFGVVGFSESSLGGDIDDHGELLDLEGGEVEGCSEDGVELEVEEPLLHLFYSLDAWLHQKIDISCSKQEIQQ